MRYTVEFVDEAEIPREVFRETVNAESSQEARRKALKKIEKYGIERSNIKILSAVRSKSIKW